MGLLKLRDYPHLVRLLTSIREEDGHNWLIANHYESDWMEELVYTHNDGTFYEHRVYGFKDSALAAEFALRFS